MFCDFQTKTPVSIILYACFHSKSNTFVDKHKKAWKHSWSVNFHIFAVVSYSYADSVALRSNHLLLVECLFDAKVLLNGHAATPSYVFVAFQSEATKHKSYDWLIRHAKKTIVKKILMQYSTNLNYISYISDILIEICNIHTITFGYQFQLVSQFTFNLDLAWIAFDCLLWV